VYRGGAKTSGAGCGQTNDLESEPGQRAGEAAGAEGLNEHRTHNKEILWDLGTSQTFGQCRSKAFTTHWPCTEKNIYNQPLLLN